MPEDSGADDGNVSHDNHDEHKKLYHWVYVAGWCLLSAVIDFAFLWPESHLWAFLALAAALSLPTIYELTVVGLSRWFVAAAVVLWFTVAIGANWIVGPIQITETEVTGTLQPASDQTPPNGCDRPPPKGEPGLPAGALRVLIGTNAVAKIGAGRFAALKIGRCPVLSMERVADRISVNAELYDAQGKLVATVRDGAIHAIVGENSRIRRDGDLSTLIITDASGSELLYIRYLNPTTIRVRGLFGCAGHPLVRITDDGFQPSGFKPVNSCFAGTGGGISID